MKKIRNLVIAVMLSLTALFAIGSCGGGSNHVFEKFIAAVIILISDGGKPKDQTDEGTIIVNCTPALVGTPPPVDTLEIYTGGYNVSTLMYTKKFDCYSAMGQVDKFNLTSGNYSYFLYHSSTPPVTGSSGLPLTVTKGGEVPITVEY